MLPGADGRGHGSKTAARARGLPGAAQEVRSWCRVVLCVADWPDRERAVGFACARRILALGDRTDLVEAAVDMTWADWGAGLPLEERQRWVEVAKGDADRRRVPAGFFAPAETDHVIGTVALQRLRHRLTR